MHTLFWYCSCMRLLGVGAVLWALLFIACSEVWMLWCWLPGCTYLAPCAAV